MAKPANTIKKIKPNPTGDTYDICPTIMTDETGTYKAELPTLTQDEVIATMSDITVDSIETTGSGNAITSATLTDKKITFTKGSTFLTAHQTLKTLNTNNTSAQSVSASESIAGSGTINLHKVAKTGNFSDLNGTGSVVKDGAILMPTNPFGGRSIYINSLNNAFASADKKYYVTVTEHYKTSGGVTYPYADTSKAITDDDYYVDGPIARTLTASAHNLFDGSYETGLSAAKTGDTYLKIRIMFGSNDSPSGSSSYFPGYPYGEYYLSFYYNNTPNVLPQCRVYNQYPAHTKGWHLYTGAMFTGTLGSTNNIIKFTDSNDYQRTCVDFIVYGNETSGRVVQVSEIDYKLSRPDLSRDGSTVTKYGDQKLYFPFRWYSNPTTQTVEINSDGTITAKKFKLESSTAIAPANGQNVAVYTSNGFERTTSTFDGSTTTKFLSQKGTFEAQVQTDWNASSGVAQILNKPTIPDAVTANPTLAGTEDTLIGIQVGNTKYKVVDTEPFTAVAGTDFTDNSSIHELVDLSNDFKDTLKEHKDIILQGFLEAYQLTNTEVKIHYKDKAVIEGDTTVTALLYEGYVSLFIDEILKFTVLINSSNEVTNVEYSTIPLPKGLIIESGKLYLNNGDTDSATGMPFGISVNTTAILTEALTNYASQQSVNEKKLICYDPDDPSHVAFVTLPQVTRLI